MPGYKHEVLKETHLNLVSERSRSEAASNGSGSDIRRELEDGTLPVRTSRDDADVSRVLDGGDRASCQEKLLPGLTKVDHVRA